MNQAFVELKKAALKFKKSSDELALITDNDLTMPGSMAQINGGYCVAANLSSFSSDSQGKSANIFLLPEAYVAGKDFYDMQQLQLEIQNKFKLQMVDIMGFTGDILSGDHPGYKSYGKIRGTAY